MIVLDTAQTWSVIAVLSTALLGMVTFLATVFVRVLRAEFTRVHDRLDHLDRDVTALMRHAFGIERD